LSTVGISRKINYFFVSGRMDIVGAAETGSGKTLAFGIPIVQGILQDRRQEQTGRTEQVKEGGGESADQEKESVDEMEAESPDSLLEEEANDKLVSAEGNKKKGQSTIRTVFGNRSLIRIQIHALPSNNS
jgi:hypothetical protein